MSIVLYTFISTVTLENLCRSTLQNVKLVLTFTAGRYVPGGRDVTGKGKGVIDGKDDNMQIE